MPFHPLDNRAEFELILFKTDRLSLNYSAPYNIVCHQLQLSHILRQLEFHPILLLKLYLTFSSNADFSSLSRFICSSAND